MEQIRPKPLSDTSVFFRAIAGFAVAALVMLGFARIVYIFVAPGGWLSQIFDRSLPGGLAAILALLVIGMCVKLMHNLVPAGNRIRYSEAFAYGFAAAGAIYSIEYLVKGGL